MEEKYPFYHPLYVPPTRTMKEVKADFNKHLQKTKYAEDSPRACRGMEN